MGFKPVSYSRLSATDKARRREVFEILGILHLHDRDVINNPIDVRLNILWDMGDRLRKQQKRITEEEGCSHNRHHSVVSVETYRRDIDAVRFRPWGAAAPLGISYEGKLYEGNQRLMAQNESKTRATLEHIMVCLDCEPDDAFVTGKGVPKTLIAMLHSRGKFMEFSFAEEAVTKFLPREIEGRIVHQGAARWKGTIDELVAMFTAYEAGIRFMWDSMKSGTHVPGVCCAPVRAAAVRAFYCYDESEHERLRECLDLLHTGESKEGTKTHPEDGTIISARDYLVAHSDSRTNVETAHIHRFAQFMIWCYMNRRVCEIRKKEAGIRYNGKNYDFPGENYFDVRHLFPAGQAEIDKEKKPIK